MDEQFTGENRCLSTELIDRGSLIETIRRLNYLPPRIHLGRISMRIY